MFESPDPTPRRDPVRGSPDLDPLLLRAECAAMLGGVTVKTIQRYEKSGVLPPPIRVTSRVVGHRRSTIERLLSQSGAERGG